MEFAIRLKELRLEKGLTQKQLAEKLNVHQTTVKDWEVRGCEPSYRILVQIASILDISIDYLLGYKDI